MSSSHWQERLAAWSLLGLISSLAGSAPARAQVPDKFTNLQELPKTISRGALVETMRSFSFGLGVRCQHCHVAKGDPARGNLDFDFASDEKAPKRTARQMIAMVRAINDDYVAKLGDAPVKVQCFTCHHGVPSPKTLEALLSETLAEKGLDAALAHYDKLRKEFYGSGAYDFSEGPLCRLAERLLRDGRAPEAITLLKVNVERNPEAGWPRQLLGDAYRDSGDLVQARAAYEALLKLEPENEFYKSLITKLEKLEAKK
jgi:tetratricopeptide (TPR) repeat protein